MPPYLKRQQNRSLAAAARYAYAVAGRPSLEVPVIVDVLVRRGRCMDADNILAAVKRGWDTIFNRNLNGEGITPNDSAKWVSIGRIEQQTGKEWKGREELVLTIVPREEDTDAE